MQSVIAVSYTHLDVYKRQLQDTLNLTIDEVNKSLKQIDETDDYIEVSK